ncbi:hypothetical protein CC86DRAFT_51666 [Ophiobolus disseminans]|uniref:Uncharacterized protein n=1 Tax=Ophiobolus disseminans TaxID=1469910 RepID=A0A6A6ZTQ9_9PLEO|nr:hypothetical protein CC86DRAFT_51666 [Ophiobolus disseminans]
MLSADAECSFANGSRASCVASFRAADKSDIVFSGTKRAYGKCKQRIRPIAISLCYATAAITFEGERFGDAGHFLGVWCRWLTKCTGISGLPRCRSFSCSFQLQTAVSRTSRTYTGKLNQPICVESLLKLRQLVKLTYLYCYCYRFIYEGARIR